MGQYYYRCGIVDHIAANCSKQKGWSVRGDFKRTAESTACSNGREEVGDGHVTGGNVQLNREHKEMKNLCSPWTSVQSLKGRRRNGRGFLGANASL